MHYRVDNNSNRHFEIFNEADDLAGTMDFEFWRMSRATLALPNSIEYHTAATGFWQTTVSITRDGLAFAEIKPDWGWGLKLTLPDHAQPFVFKKRSVWNSDYTLVDAEGNEIAYVLVDFSWRNWHFDYKIEVHPNTLDKEINSLLPMLMVYCTRYVRMRHAVAT